MCRLCGVCEGCKPCTEYGEFGATDTPTLQPASTLEPETPSPSATMTAAPSFAETESPAYLPPSEGGAGGIGDCPVEAPETEFCSDSQEAIECTYGCVCCNAETEFDEVGGQKPSYFHLRLNRYAYCLNKNNSGRIVK